MDNIYVLDQSFNILGVIDEYVSTIWTLSYSDVGDFEIYLSATDKAVALLDKNRYVVRSADAEVDEDGNVTYKKVMIIKGIQINTNVETGDYLTVTGRELKYILHQRIVWKQSNFNGTAEAAIRSLVTDNAISPTNTKRQIPNLVLGVSAGLSDTIEKQVTGEYLDVAISEICLSFNYGWDIYVYNGHLVFIVYQGLNRSYDQSELPYVVFSESFDNLYNSEYVLNYSDYANTTLIGGEGEGLERVYTTVGDNYSGLNRFETFTDARDLSQNKGSDDEITLSAYYNLLRQRGRENMAELTFTEAFTGEVLSDMTFKYMEDFDLGDMVSVINRYGITKTVRVVGATESFGSEGKKLIPQFNI